MQARTHVQALGRSVHRLILLMAVVAISACATSEHKEKRACAFEDAKKGECVVDFVCRHEDPALCDVIIKHLRTREFVKAPATTTGLNLTCDGHPILCTCCDLKVGCFPCPKEG